MELKPSVKEVYLKLAKYCDYQERSHKEVGEKLRSFDLDEEDSGTVILLLMRENYLNEERYARMFTRSKFNQKKWGRNKIRQALKWKDVSERNIEIGLSEIEQGPYYGVLYALLEKKRSFEKEQHPLKLRKKLFEFAYRKGYESGLIHEVLNELLE